jgi:DNA-binding NarL/FixJ family response regulator
MYEESDRADAMRSAGAVAYLSKTGQLNVLVDTIRSVAGPQRAQMSEHHA